MEGKRKFDEVVAVALAAARARTPLQLRKMYEFAHNRGMRPTTVAYLLGAMGFDALDYDRIDGGEVERTQDRLVTGHENSVIEQVSRMLACYQLADARAAGIPYPPAREEVARGA